MSFLAKVSQARELLATHRRVSVRALGKELGLEAEDLNDLVEELVEIQQVAKLDGKTLVWREHEDPPPCRRSDVSRESAAGEGGQTHWRLKPLLQGSGIAESLSYTPRHLAYKIFASRSAMEGEKKQVTVLFCDVVGSMHLAKELKL